MHNCHSWRRIDAPFVPGTSHSGMQSGCFKNRYTDILSSNECMMTLCIILKPAHLTSQPYNYLSQCWQPFARLMALVLIFGVLWSRAGWKRPFWKSDGALRLKVLANDRTSFFFPSYFMVVLSLDFECHGCSIARCSWEYRCFGSSTAWYLLGISGRYFSLLA